MTDQVINTSSTNSGSAKLVYILYLASIVFGITGLIGLIMAYINKGDAPEWLKTHYQYQIRTFWIGLLYFSIGIATTFILVGFLILLFFVIWLIVRCIKGMKALDQQQAHPNPTSWFF